MPWNKPYQPAANQRLDLTVYAQPGNIVFITIRAYVHQSPFVSPSLNQMIVDTLAEEAERQHCWVYTYCLMPDHLHFLVSSRVEGVSTLKFTDQYKGKTTNRSWKLGWQGKLWQPRYYDHVIRTEESLRNIANYIWDNPMRKRLIPSDGEWPWRGQIHPLPD